MALENHIKGTAHHCVTDVEMMKGCSGEEQSTGHELGFLGTSWFMRKKAGAWTDLLRLVGTVDRNLIHVV